jgi:hypothetical protein
VVIPRQPREFLEVAIIVEHALELVSWIDPATATWIEQRSQVGIVLARRP